MYKTKDGITYTIPLEESEETPGETCIYRSTLVPSGSPLVEVTHEGVDTVKKTFLKSVHDFSTENFIGKRTWNIDNDGNKTAGKYEWRTYKQVYEDWDSLAKAIMELKLYNEQWVVTDLACQLWNIGVVTFYDILGANSTEFILEQCKLSTIASTSDHVEYLIKIKKEKDVPYFQNIILFDEISDELQHEADEIDLKIIKFDDLLLRGLKSDLELDDSKPNNLFTICYTSGTTGNPKGVMLTNRSMVGMCATQANSPIKFHKSDIHISYLPLAHVLERFALYTCISNGSKYGLYQGDIHKLNDDLKTLRPTVFISVPILFTMLYDIIQSKINKLKGCAKKLTDRAIRVKLENLHKTGTTTHCLYDMLVFK